MPAAVRISPTVWLRAEQPRQRPFMAGTGTGTGYAAISPATGEMTPATYRAARTPPATARTGPDPLSALAALPETQYLAGPFQAPPWPAALAEPIPGRDR